MGIIRYIFVMILLGITITLTLNLKNIRYHDDDIITLNDSIIAISVKQDSLQYNNKHETQLLIKKIKMKHDVKLLSSYDNNKTLLVIINYLLIYMLISVIYNIEKK